MVHRTMIVEVHTTTGSGSRPSPVPRSWTSKAREVGYAPLALISWRETICLCAYDRPNIELTVSSKLFGSSELVGPGLDWDLDTVQSILYVGLISERNGFPGARSPGPAKKGSFHFEPPCEWQRWHPRPISMLFPLTLQYYSETSEQEMLNVEPYKKWSRVLSEMVRLRVCN